MPSKSTSTDTTTDPLAPTGEVSRLSVNINADTAAKLRWYKDNKHISITETVRRAVALLYLVEQETEGGNEILIRSKDGKSVRQLWMV
ncbi:hypothetical protein [Streptomyces sp. GESEQ-4]|uniref:hypothetical protein n=1 Tax=Streptomyces sp. GESEQ-4 TaxID=2812655 RepID=UPI001B31D81B|nr:hypothetical protein [Streptomyces sp. GESEQ-4]